MLEIFYLLIIFNVFMSIFGMMTLGNGDKLGAPSPGSSSGFDTAENPDTHSSIVTLADFISIMTVLMGALVGLYVVTTFTGTAKTPLSAVYGFGIVFQVVYMSAWYTFWRPLIQWTPESMSGITAVIGLLFSFLVESIFIIGFIQMSTGGWGLYK